MVDGVERLVKSSAALPVPVDDVLALLPSLHTPSTGAAVLLPTVTAPPLPPRPPPPPADAVYSANLLKRGFTAAHTEQYVAYWQHVQGAEQLEAWHSAVSERDANDEEERKRTRERGRDATQQWTWDEWQRRRKPNATMLRL